MILEKILLIIKNQHQQTQCFNIFIKKAAIEVNKIGLKQNTELCLA